MASRNMTRSETAGARPAGPAAAASAAAAGPRAPRRGGSDRQRRKLRKAAELSVLLGPAVVLFLGFVITPIAVGAYYSLYNWNGFGPLSDFTGLHNYKLAFGDPAFIQSIEHTLILTGLALVIQGPLSIGIALLLNRKFFGRAFMRLVVFAPYVLPPAVTAVMWALLLQPGGFVDQVMKAVGLGGLVNLWLANIHIVLYTAFAVLTWQYIGFGIVLLLAGLQGVPVELKEAAAIDGATPWQVTRRVTLPLLGPTLRIWVFLTVIGSLQVFDIIWLMTGGGPADASDTMATYMYRTGFQTQAFGYGSTIAIIMFIICFVFSLIYQRFALRRDTAGALTRAVG
jgi:raffinose/stachyose/melibiose transport system permease protein